MLLKPVKILKLEQFVLLYYCLLPGEDVTIYTLFSIKDSFSKCNQIRRKLRIWSHLLKESLMESFIFRGVQVMLHQIDSLPKHQSSNCM